MHPPPLFSQILLGHSLSLPISQYYINHNRAPPIPLVFLLSPESYNPETGKEGGTAKGVVRGVTLG